MLQSFPVKGLWRNSFEKAFNTERKLPTFTALANMQFHRLMKIRFLQRPAFYPIKSEITSLFSHNFQPIDGPVIASLNLTSEILFNPPICRFFRVPELLYQEDRRHT